MDKEKAQQYRSSLTQTLILTPNKQERRMLLAAHQQTTSYRNARNSVHPSGFGAGVTRMDEQPIISQVETTSNLLSNLLYRNPENMIVSVQLSLFEGRERDIILEKGVQVKATPFIEVSRYPTLGFIGNDLGMTSVTIKAKLSQKVGRKGTLEGRISASGVDVVLWFRVIEMINMLKEFRESDMGTAYDLATDMTIDELVQKIRETKHFDLFGGKPRKTTKKEADRKIAKNSDFIERMGGNSAREEVLRIVPQGIEEIIRSLLEKGISIQIKSVESELTKGTISDSPMLQQLLAAARQADQERYERFAKVREYYVASGKKDKA